MANTLNGPQTPNKKVVNRNGSTPMSFGLGFLPSFHFESPSTLLDSISPRGFFQASVSLGKVTENLKEESDEDRRKNTPQLEMERKRDSSHLTPTAKFDKKKLKRNNGHMSRQISPGQAGEDHSNEETISSRSETVEELWSLHDDNKGSSSMFTSIYEEPESEILESSEIMNDTGPSCSEIPPKKITKPVSEIIVNEVGPGDEEDSIKHRRHPVVFKGSNYALSCNEDAKPTDSGNTWNSKLDNILLELFSKIKNGNSDASSTSGTSVKRHLDRLSEEFHKHAGIVRDTVQIEQRIAYLRGVNDRNLSCSDAKNSVESRLQNLVDTDLSDIVDHKDEKDHDTTRHFTNGAKNSLRPKRKSVNDFNSNIKTNPSGIPRNDSSIIPVLLFMNDSSNKRQIINSLLLSKNALKCKADLKSVGLLLKEMSVGMILNDSLMDQISKNDIPFWKIDSKLNLKPNYGVSDSTMIPSGLKHSTGNFEDYGVSTFFDIEVDRNPHSPPQPEWKCVTSVFKNHRILLQKQETMKGFLENANQGLKFRIPFLQDFWTGVLSTLEYNSNTAATLRSLFVLQRIYSETSPGENSLCAVIAHEFDLNSELEGCALATRIKFDYQNRTDTDDSSGGTIDSSGHIQGAKKRYSNIVPKMEPFSRPHTKNKLTLNVAKSKSTIPDRAPLSAPPERGYVPPFHNNLNLPDRYFQDPVEQHFAMNHPCQSQNSINLSDNYHNAMRQNISLEQNFEDSPVPLRPKATPDLASLHQLPPNLMGDFMKYSPESNPMSGQNTKSTIGETSGNFVDMANNSFMTSTPLKIPGEVTFKMSPPPSYIHQNGLEGPMQSNQHKIMSTPSRSNYMNHNMGQYYPYSNPFYNMHPTFQDPFGGQDRPLMNTRLHTSSFQLFSGVTQDPAPNLEGNKYYDYPTQRRPLSESNREKYNSKGITFCQILEYDPSKDSRNNMRKNSSKKGTGVHKFPAMTPVNMYKPKK